MKKRKRSREKPRHAAEQRRERGKENAAAPCRKPSASGGRPSGFCCYDSRSPEAVPSGIGKNQEKSSEDSAKHVFGAESVLDSRTLLAP